MLATEVSPAQVVADGNDVGSHLSRAQRPGRHLLERDRVLDRLLRRVSPHQRAVRGDENGRPVERLDAEADERLQDHLPGRPLVLTFDLCGGERARDGDGAVEVVCAEEVKRLGLRFVVVTSVTRDDLPDGGAGHFARVIEVMRSECPGVGIEVLIPDLQGSRAALKTVVDATPEVLNHNVETVPRLYASVRPQADYRRSLEVLREAKALNPSLTTKSGLMVGLGETREEVLEVMVDLRSASCAVITIGQYLSPSAGHHPVVEYVHPEIFEKYRRDAIRLGFRDAASSPFVRSSYMAEKYYRQREQGPG